MTRIFTKSIEGVDPDALNDILGNTDDRIDIKELIGSYPKETCFECGSTELVSTGKAKLLSPCVYRLWDEVVCKQCGHIAIKDDRKVDLNTDKTRAVLAKNDPLAGIKAEIKSEDLLA